MKWGIRRGRAGKAYSKGVKKLKKMEKKSEKLSNQSAKAKAVSGRYQLMADKAISRGRHKKGEKLARKAREYDSRSRITDYKNQRLQQKGKKFYRKMEKTFKDVSVDQLDPEDIKYGKRYANNRIMY